MYDFAEIVKSSRRFYRDHGLVEWSRLLPKQPTPTRDVEELLAHADRSGFDQALALPRVDEQLASFDRLVECCARQQAAELPDNQQYREPFLADDWSRTANGRVVQRPDDLGERTLGAYVFLFGIRPLANCWGKTGKQIAEQFRSKSWHGFTVTEYLAIQRRLALRHRDHRFFAEPEDPTAHWLWLIDSMNDTDCAVAYGSARGINIQATGVNNRESKRAALAGVVVPLRP